MPSLPSIFKNTSNHYVPIGNNRSSVETNGSQSDTAPLLPQSPSAGRTNGPLKALKNWLTKSPAQKLHRAIRAENPKPTEIEHIVSVANTANPSSDLNAASNRGNGIRLHTAVELGQLSVVEYLIERGGARSVINAKDHKGRTPFYQAAKNKNAAVMEYLSSNGADINEADQKGNTPVHRAIKDKNWGVMTWLRSQGANLDQCNKKGNAPLHTVLLDKQIARTERWKKLGFLLSNGANPDVTTKNGDTSLHLATVTEQSEAVYLLCGYGADTEKKNAQGKTPMDLARSSNGSLIYNTINSARLDRGKILANLRHLRDEQVARAAPPSYEQEQAAVSTDVGNVGMHTHRGPRGS